jgi:hypothetical protein
MAKFAGVNLADLYVLSATVGNELGSMEACVLIGDRVGEAGLHLYQKFVLAKNWH